jgi:Ca2+-binding EF-hand superfamily protein
VNGDGKVTVKDLVLVALHLGKKQGQWGYHPKYDVNGDGKIGLADLFIVLHQLGRRC